MRVRIQKGRGWQTEVPREGVLRVAMETETLALGAPIVVSLAPVTIEDVRLGSGAERPSLSVSWASCPAGPEHPQTF